jgi:Alcohol dehydrogenase GroES-like domain
MHGAGDVRVEEVPDPTIQEPTDAVVRVVRSGVCGSDLWAYGSMPASEQGRPMGHEFLGLMEDLGAEVSGLKRRDLVVTPGSARRSATCSPQWVIADNATLADGIATAPFLTDPPRLNETSRFTFVRMSANGIEASPAFEGWLYDQAYDSSAEVSGEAGEVKAPDKEALWK